MPSGLEVATATRTGMGFFAIIRMFMYIFVFGIIFINFLVIAVGQHDGKSAVKYLGTTFLQSTSNLQDESLKLIERGTTIPVDATKLQTIWFFIKSIWGMFSAFFIIYIWLAILAWIFLKFPLSDNSKGFAAWIIAILIFLMAQMVITAKFSDRDFWTPILAFRDFGLAIYSLFAPIAERAINYSKNYTNYTNNSNLTNVTIVT
jgi:hypothetical protein